MENLSDLAKILPAASFIKSNQKQPSKEAVSAWDAYYDALFGLAPGEELDRLYAEASKHN